MSPPETVPSTSTSSARNVSDFVDSAPAICMVPSVSRTSIWLAAMSESALLRARTVTGTAVGVRGVEDDVPPASLSV